MKKELLERKIGENKSKIQKTAHDSSKPLVLFTNGETVSVHNKREYQNG